MNTERCFLVHPVWVYVILVLAIGSLTACSSEMPSAAEAVPVSGPVTGDLLETEIIDYQPIFSGESREGYCWMSSLISDSLGAWRCLVEDEIFDPCFALQDGTVVICGADPVTGKAGFKLDLTDPLPEPDAVNRSQNYIWLFELVDGTLCEAASEGRDTVNGQPITYRCASEKPDVEVVVIGDLQSGHPWMAEKATLISHSEGEESTQDIQTLAVKTIWRFTVPQDTSALSGAAPTTIVDYIPQRPEGESERGICLTNSLAMPSKAAWRCNVGDLILDPCFVLPGEQSVVCNPNPITGDPGVWVQLTEPLPQPDLAVEREDGGWLVELHDGTICNFATGATGVIEGKRISYVCETASGSTGDIVVLGDLQPGKVWLAEKARLSFGDDGVTAEESQMVPLRMVVRGPMLFSPAACDNLVEAMSAVLDVKVTRTEVPFTDYIGGGRGLGCLAAAAGTDFESIESILTSMDAIVSAQGWEEDAAYAGDSPLGSARAFRRGHDLCLLNVGWEPSEGVVCDAQPLTACEVPAGQKRYIISLNCAEDLFAVEASDVPVSTPSPPERIVFEPDTTAKTLNRAIAAGEIQEYVVRAMDGQRMLAAITTPEEDVFLTIYGLEDGVPLVRSAADATYWAGRLPGTQDYALKAVSRGNATNFSLEVVIPITLQFSEPGVPVSVDGMVNPDEVMHYVFAGTEGEAVTVTLTSPGEQAFLTVYGMEDGVPLVRAASESLTWSGMLELTQDYVVQVVSGGARADYVLEIAAQ